MIRLTPITFISVVFGIAATAGTLYTADMIGACVGAMVVGALLVPLLGVWWVCLLVAGLKLLSAIILGVSRG